MVTRSNTFKKNLILFLVPQLIPLLILGTFAIVITRRYIQEDINRNNFRILQQTKKNMELIFDELDSLNLNFGTNPEIIVTLKRIFDNPEPETNFEEYHSLTTISNFIDAPANARPYIHSIYIYFDNRQRKLLTTIAGLTNLDLFFDKTWYQSYTAHKLKDSNFWSEVRNLRQYTFTPNTIKVWTAYRKLYSTTGYKKSIGVIVLNIYADYLQQFFDNADIQPKQTFFIADRTHTIIFSNKKLDDSHKKWLTQYIGKHNRSSVLKFAGVPYAVSQIYSEKYGLYYLSVVPLRELYKIPTELQYLTLLLLLISFGLGLTFTYYLTKRNYSQVKDIVSIIDSAKNGLPLPNLPSINDEYSYITHNILKTFIEQNYLKVQLSERKYRLQFMELLALQSQINPHFLFNTLETIKWKIFQYNPKPNEATKMVEELSEILHYSLESPHRMVTIAEEIDNARCYIMIQKIRYSNKFDIIWEYDQNIKTVPMIRLIFQPLLENCIYHGIKEKDGKSIIKIKIRQLASALKISIIDNGLGIERQRLAAILKSLAAENNTGSNIGLYNTNKRLILTYGESAAIHIHSKLHFGTVVYFYIPFQLDEDGVS
jgi:two-component system, sensor histidine kinase YesM